MKITDNSGTYILNENEIPSNDDKNLIIGSVTTDSNFIACCNASVEWDDNLTNEQFLAKCEEWVAAQ